MIEHPPSEMDVDATVDADAEVPATPNSGEWRALGDTVLGVGSSCEVVLGRQTSLDRDVALKRLLPNRRHVAGRERLLAEGRLLGRLEHPNIVPLHGLWFDDGGWPCLMLKRVKGETWEEVLRRERLPDGTLAEPERHLRVLIEVCFAVSFAHEQGVLHLDLKPSNILLGNHGETYVADWGSALTVPPGSDGVVLPPGSSPRGTPRFLAPELARAAEGTFVDGRADVFSLGVVARELLVGPSTVAATADGLAPSGLDPEAQALVLRATAVDRETRFPTVTAFRAALEAYLKHATARVQGRDARARLQRLKALCETPDTSAADIQEAFVECRFACDQSLRSYSEQPAVKAVRDEAHLLMAQRALHRGDIEGAEAHKDALLVPSGLLESQLAAARHARAKSVRDATAVREKLRGHDVAEGLDTRRRAAFWLGHATLLGAVAAWLAAGAPPALGYPQMWLLDGGHLLLALAVPQAVQRHYFPNAAVRRLWTAWKTMVFFGLIALLMASGLGQAAFLGLVWRLTVFAVAGAYAAMLFAHRRFWMTAGVHAVCAGVTALWPDAAGAVWMTSTWLALVLTSQLPRGAGERLLP